MGVAVSNMNVQFWVESDGWTDIVADTIAIEGLRFSYGITGNGPLDVCASVGTLEFTLNNKASNSGGLQGYYSPLHSNARTAWNVGRLVRVQFTYDSTDYVKWYGKIVSIDPEPGAYGSQRVHVRGEDGVADLLHGSVRALTLETDQNESDLIAAVLDALPADAQPPAQDLDTGVDVIPYAFDALQGNAWALPIIRDLAQSSNGLFCVQGDGTARYINRVNRSTSTSAVTLTNTMHGFAAPSQIAGILNKARVTIHPKSISPAATEELYASMDGASIVVNYGETVTLWVDYTDPNDRETRVGGANVVTAVAEGTHYHAYYPDLYLPGGGNPTAAITVTLTAFGASAKWTFENDGALALPVYVESLVVIGKALRDLGEESYESSAEYYYGERAMAVDLPYQGAGETARGMAQWIVDQYSRETRPQIAWVKFLANDSDTLMTQALAREPGDCVTLTETMTGTAAVRCIIHSVSFEVEAPRWIRCRWGVAPASPWAMWSLGTTGFTELGETTTLGF